MDDDAVVRQVAGKILKHLGYTAEFAVDGSEAIAKYQAARNAGQPFDLVIMDLTIPGGMGGKEAFETLRQIEPNTRALSAAAMPTTPS